MLSFSDITEFRPSRNLKHTVEIICSSIGYIIGLNSDGEAEMLLKDLQYLISLHQKFYQCAMSESQHSSAGKHNKYIDGIQLAIYVALGILDGRDRYKNAICFVVPPGNTYLGIKLLEVVLYSKSQNLT